MKTKIINPYHVISFQMVIYKENIVMLIHTGTYLNRNTIIILVAENVIEI